MKNITKNTDQIKVHVINVGYDVKGTDVIAHLVWRPVYPKQYALMQHVFWLNDVRHNTGTAKLQPGDAFDLKKGQRIALAKAENAAYSDLVNEVKREVEDYTRGMQQAGDFLVKANRVKAGNKRYIQRVDSGEIK